MLSTFKEVGKLFLITSKMLISKEKSFKESLLHKDKIIAEWKNQLHPQLFPTRHHLLKARKGEGVFLSLSILSQDLQWVKFLDRH